MTIGQKLSVYRKLSGFTQQQIGERLNISAQAVSKWENDQTEPDLATMRILAGIYKVSVDELIDPENTPNLFVEENEEKSTSTEEAPPASAAPIGFCKNCGICVTEENLGERAPVILCNRCLQAKEEEERNAAEKAAREAAQTKKKMEQARAMRRSAYKRHNIISVVLAALATAVFVAVMISSLTSAFTVGKLAFALIGTYVVFAFVWCLRFECVVQDVVLDWISKSIEWPGLIFTFDFDGFLWMIGMKLLFWALGILFGLATGIVGCTIGLICAPFVFPFLVKKVASACRSGEVCELLEDSILV